MDIKDIIDFEYKLIPDEYVNQILLLIQSNDENNWNLVYQLMCGFEDIDQFHVEYYFKRILRNYNRFLANKNGYDNLSLWTYFNKKSYKQ